MDEGECSDSGIRIIKVNWLFIDYVDYQQAGVNCYQEGSWREYYLFIGHFGQVMKVQLNVR